MSNEEQDSLIGWLQKNKLNFIKDALVKESFTLGMIINSTDEDIDLILKDLNISPFKRPRFREAVNTLKQERNNVNSKSSAPNAQAEEKKSAI